MPQYRLGLDIGGVIRDSGYIGGEVPQAIDGLATLVASGFFAEIHLVSQCVYPARSRVLRWLTTHRVWSTGLLREDLEFCSFSAQKARIAEALKLTHFVDNRIGILQCLPETVSFRYLFGGLKPSLSMPHITHVFDWQSLCQHLLGKPPRS